MIVCVCKRVSDSTIRDAFEDGARRLRDLREDLGVASCCGRCADCANKLLRECAQQGKADAVEALAAESASAATPAKYWFPGEWWWSFGECADDAN